MDILWTQSQQQAIKKISDNRITAMFNTLAVETQVNDLQPLLGFDFFQNIVQNPTGEWNKKLLDGGTYTYNDVTYFYSGLITVLCYFFKARWIAQSNEFDTFVGMVEKNLDDSNALQIGAIKNRINSVKKTAFKYWEECEKFIIANSSEFPYSKLNPLNTNICSVEKRKAYYL